MVQLRKLLLAVCVWFVGSWSVQAQVATPALLTRIEAAKQEFRPVPASDVAAAKYRLQWKMYELDQFLYASGQQNRAAWKAFLGWEKIEAELKKPNPDGLALLETVFNFKENESGLEMDRFTKVRDALQEYAQLELTAGTAELEKVYAEQLDRLAAELPKFDAEPTVDNALTVGQLLGWFETRRQAPALVAQIRNRFDRPNAHIYIRSQFLSKAVDRAVLEPSPVRDNILGTNIFGQACLVGNLHMKTIPCQDHARMKVELVGNVSSNTNGYQKSVTVHSLGNTSVYAHKTLDLTPDVLCGTPAIACCDTQTKICSITSSKLPGLIEPIAWKKAAKQMPQAEAIASQRAEARIEKRMNEESLELIANNNQRLRELKYPLVRRDALPELKFSTTDSHLFATAKRAGVGQVGGFDSPPNVSLAWDITGQVHETAVVNYGEAYLGGVTITDEKLARIVKERTGSVPEELQLSPDKDPWSITFANEAPLRARFENDQVKLTIRGRRFTRGENAIADTIEISATYDVAISPTGSELKRQGEVGVEFVNRKVLGAQQTVFKTFLRRKFEALFKEEITGTGFALKGDFERFGKLQLKHVVMDKGWATAGLDLVAIVIQPATKPIAAVPVEIGSQIVLAAATVDLRAITPPTRPSDEAGL